MDKSPKKKSSIFRKRIIPTLRKKASVNKSFDETDTNSKELNKKSRNATKKSKEPPALSSASPPPIETKSKSNVPKVLSAKGGRSNVSPEKTTMTEVSTIRANVVPPMCIFEKEITQEYDPVEDFAQNQANSKKIKWVGDDVARQFVENLPNEQTISQEYYFLESFEIKKSCDAFQNNMERNRSNKHIVLDENRVILDRPGSENLNYINASRINVPDFANKLFVAQLPKLENESFVEDFWYMVHQEQINIIYLLCSEELTGPQVPTKLFKDGAQEYQYVGKMFIHTRKSETLHDLKINTIEVLPEGMSDAVICQVHQLQSWKPGKEPKKIRLVIKMIHEFLNERDVHNSTVCVVSTFGSGRACCFLAALIAIAQINRGILPKIAEIFKSIKLQRPGATENIMSYLTTYLIVLDYIKRKLGDKDINSKIVDGIKSIRNIMTKMHEGAHHHH